MVYFHLWFVIPLGTRFGLSYESAAELTVDVTTKFADVYYCKYYSQGIVVFLSK